jgi:peptidoglycan/LPS O-acetylase OafA/YrhL
MPLPAERHQRYVPGLDGLRAVAVLCVIAYHIGAPWARGGMLGVGVFFTLSGYLITDLLLEHYRRNGDLGLGQFWLRRARRLLPALFLMLAVVSVWVAVFDASQLDAVRRQVISGAFYFANWSTIAAHGSYFARFAAPLPLDHLWSLSIEEQFYLVWPWLLLLGIALYPNRKGLAGLTLLLAAVSVLLMGQLYHPGNPDPTRVYEGTDTRAFELLIGCALAMMRPTHFPRYAGRRPSVRRVAVLDLLGLAGLAAIVVLVTDTNAFSAFLYPQGFLLLTLATAAIIAAVVHSASALGLVLGSRPLRWIGVRSYGIYLWQWPIVVLWGQPSSGVNWGQAVLQLAVTVVVAALSWRYVEEPIRRGALGRLWKRARSSAGVLSARRTTFALSGTTFGIVLVATVGLGGLLPQASAGHRAAPEISRLPPPLKNTAAVIDPVPRAPHEQLPPPTKTSCRSVVYIGDSTSEGQVSTKYIPNARDLLWNDLARVGVRTTHAEVSGARSIVEVYHGIPDAATVARSYVASGYRGCWILALGTNEAADVAVGSNVGLEGRIARMMKIIGNQPVLWVDAITLLSATPYAESGMRRWDQDLVAACNRYPNMRIVDWAAHARRKWFIPDGIHYYSPGAVARNQVVARGLVQAFPRGQPPSPTCLVTG